MYRIDDLITEIHNNEAIEIPGELTGEQRKRVEAYIQSMITEKVKEQQSFSAKSENIYINRRKGVSRRRRTVVILAATLILTLGLTVFAARQNEWDITLLNFMGLSESDVLQLDGGEVIINKKTTSTWTDYAKKPAGEKKQISITEITSIGDKNSAYLRINTDYELPEEFNEKTDYILPDSNGINITYKNMFGREEIHTFASMYMSIYEEGKLSFLVSIEGCENLNKCNVSMCIEDLYWYHDLGQYEETNDSEPEELLAAGKWEIEWRYSYKSNAKTRHKIKKLSTEEGELLLTKTEISPISIRIEAIRSPKDRDLSWTTDMLEEIHYKDGRIVKVDRKGSGGIRNGIFIEEFVNVYYLGEVLEPDEIAYLMICGEKVEF